MPATASTRSAAVTSGRTSPRRRGSVEAFGQPAARMSPKRSSSAECSVRSAAISPTRPGSAARAAGVVSTATVRRTISRTSPASEPVSGSCGRVADREHRLVDEVRLARPAPVDRRLAGAGPLGDRVDRQVGVAGLAEQLDRRAQHRAVDARIAGSAKVCRHYETQSNISRRDRRHAALVHLDDLAEPRFSPEVEQIRDLMASMAPDCPLDADALHAKASADTGLDDFGPDDYRERLDVYLAALQEIGGMHAAGHRQLLRAAAAVAQEPAAAHRPADATPRDPRHRTAAAGRHRGPAPHRHHPSAQPAGGGARPSAPCRTGRASSRFRCRPRWVSSRIRAGHGWTSRSSS